MDLSQTALKYLKNTETNINNVLVMAGDFNIKDNSWDFSFPHHSIHCDLLTDIVDSMSLCIFKFTNQVPTRYSDNQNNLNSVINLIFLWLTSLEFEEHIQTKKHTIIKNSKEKKNFLAELIESIKELNMEYISSKENLEWIVQEFANNMEEI